MVNKVVSYLKKSIVILNGLLIPFYSALGGGLLWIIDFKRIKYISFTDIIVVSFSFLYPVILYLLGTNTVLTTIESIILLLSVFLFGKNLNFSNKTEKNMFLLYFASYIAYAFLIFITTDIDEFETRRFTSPYTGMEMNSPSIVLLGTFSFIFIPLINRKKKIISICITLLSICTVFFVGFVGARTPFLILMIIIVYNLFVRVEVKNILYTIFTSFSVVLPIYYYVYLPNSILFLAFTRFEEMELGTSRFEMIGQFFNIFDNNLFGSQDSMANTFGYSYFHNIFMDIYDVSGIIPLILTLFLFIIYTKNSIYLIVKGGEAFSNVLISLFIVVFAYYNLEPIAHFNIDFLAILIFSAICTEKYKKELKKRLKTW